MTKQDQNLDPNKKSLGKDIKYLVLKTILLIAAVRVSIALFEIFFAPDLGLKHNHIIIGETLITIAVSFVIISAIRSILKNATTKIPSHFTSSISFFSIVIISLVDSLILLYIWNVQLQTILIGGGVAAIVVGIGFSTIVGNIFSGALMLTTFPAKIGDSVFIANDNVHGEIIDITMLYTKIDTEQGTEYFVPNSAIIQGNVRILREGPLKAELPFVEGDRIELSTSSEKFSGTVVKITPRFTTILDGDRDIIIANKSIFDGGITIIKKSNTNT
ncbi:MAG: mechanosensitive ion channel family protein [Thaumarchaeota archaeon]|nr:mechanosensitive ion channel family protein [Nitrososphaerota archaeon]